MKKKLLLTLAMALMLCALFAVGVSAATETASGTCGDNLTWELTDDGTLTISGTGAMTDWGPIGSAVPWYSYRDDIKAVIIESGVTSIGRCSFWLCPNLTEVTISESVSTMDTPFQNCPSLSSINVHDDNLNYCDENGILFTKNKMHLVTYPAGKTDSSYEIPASVISIRNCAFDECQNLVSIIIPDSVTVIENSVFSDCLNLASIFIPQSVSQIGSLVFSNCAALASIDVHDDNSIFCDENGILFTKDKMRLVTYPAGKKDSSYNIPDSVTSIGSSAFSYCQSLTSITIPSSVTSIGDGAFRNCPSLTIYGYTGSYAETYANANSIPFVAFTSTLTGTVASWDNTDNARYFLYPATVADADIRTEWKAGTYTTAGNIIATGTGGEITAATVDENSMYAQSFTFAGVTDGTYKLVIFKPGKYVPKIVPVTVSGGAVDAGTQMLWRYGDVNYDGAVNEQDALQIVRRGLGKASVFDAGDDVTKADRLIAADVNGDGNVNELDALQIVRYSLGKASALRNLP